MQHKELLCELRVPLQKPKDSEGAEVAKQRRRLVACRLAGVLSDGKTSQILKDIQNELPERSKVCTIYLQLLTCLSSSSQISLF